MHASEDLTASVSAGEKGKWKQRITCVVEYRKRREQGQAIGEKSYAEIKFNRTVQWF